MKVAVLMGSTSDEAKMAPARETLEKFGIEVDESDDLSEYPGN